MQHSLFTPVYRRRHRWLALSLGAAALGLGLGPVPAQAEDTPAPAAQAEDDGMSAQEIRAFAQAYLGVEQARLAAQRQMEGVQEQERATRIQQQAQTRMDAAIEEAGLSPDQYVGMAQEVNSDPELQQQVVEQLRELQSR